MNIGLVVGAQQARPVFPFRPVGGLVAPPVALCVPWNEETTAAAASSRPALEQPLGM